MVIHQVEPVTLHEKENNTAKLKRDSVPWWLGHLTA